MKPVETNPVILAMMNMKEKEVQRNTQLIYIALRYSSLPVRYGDWLFVKASHRAVQPYLTSSVFTFIRTIEELLEAKMIVDNVTFSMKHVFMIPAEGFEADFEKAKLFLKENPEINRIYDIQTTRDKIVK